MFHHLLRRARLGQGLSQREVAVLSGLPESAVSHFECGRRTPRLDTLVRLADAIGVSVDSLLGREEREEQHGKRSEPQAT